MITRCLSLDAFRMVTVLALVGVTLIGCGGDNSSRAADAGEPVAVEDQPESPPNVGDDEPSAPGSESEPEQPTDEPPSTQVPPTDPPTATDSPPTEQPATVPRPTDPPPTEPPATEAPAPAGTLRIGFTYYDGDEPQTEGDEYVKAHRKLTRPGHRKVTRLRQLCK